MTFKFNHAIRFFVGWVGGEAMALNSEVYKMAEPELSKHIRWYGNLFIKIKLYLTTGLCLHTLSTIILSVSIELTPSNKLNLETCFGYLSNSLSGGTFGKEHLINQLD